MSDSGVVNSATEASNVTQPELMVDGGVAHQAEATEVPDALDIFGPYRENYD